MRVENLGNLEVISVLWIDPVFQSWQLTLGALQVSSTGLYSRLCMPGYSQSFNKAFIGKMHLKHKRAFVNIELHSHIQNKLTNQDVAI